MTYTQTKILKGTIHGLGFKDEAAARSSVAKIRKSGRSHAHKIQAAVAMEQRARAAGKTGPAAIYQEIHQLHEEENKSQKQEEMKIKEILATKYVHPDVDKILRKYEKRAKGRSRMGYHSMMAYPYRVEGWSNKYKKSINCSNPKGSSHKRPIVQGAGRKRNENQRIHNYTIEHRCHGSYTQTWHRS